MNVLKNTKCYIYTRVSTTIQVAVIKDIIFKGKQINWKEVENYLKQYFGDLYRIAEEDELVYIGTDLPGEYAGSVYTKTLKGANAKAKANAVQAVPKMIEIASDGVFENNRKTVYLSDMLQTGKSTFMTYWK